jgi:HEAT repeat protein
VNRVVAAFLPITASATLAAALSAQEFVNEDLSVGAVATTPLKEVRIPIDIPIIWNWPLPAWDSQDSAYYDYTRAVERMDDGDFRAAALFFARIHRQYPRSVYAAESFYWHAFSLYRIGGSRNLREAVELLDLQQRLHPRTRTASDGLVLATRVRGELARFGSETAVRELSRAWRDADECSNTGTNVKVAALNAWMLYDAGMAVNHLRQTLRSDRQCGRSLREQAVFILAQIQTPESVELMLGLAQDAREHAVRVQAVQWLSEVPDPRAVAILESVLRGPADIAIKESAMYALSRLGALADPALFRDIAAGPYYPSSLRVQAIDWLSEQPLSHHFPFLMQTYVDEKSADVRHAIVRGVAGQKNAADVAWLLTVGRDSAAASRTRSLAIAAAAELNATPTELLRTYRDVHPVALRQTIIDAIGKRRDHASVDVLIDIASNEEVAALRGASIGWLRQSSDPRAVAFVGSYKER